jgi:hypothetical protein
MERAEGVAHLQAAAREMVAAGRSFLDAFEDMVEDDERLAGVVGGMTDLLGQVTSAVTRLGSTPPRRGGEERVRHIVVE